MESNRAGKAKLTCILKQGDGGDCRQAERRLSIGLRERWGNGSGFRPRPNSFCRLGRAGALECLKSLSLREVKISGMMISKGEIV